ncbi:MULTISPECIES: pyridoxamine 5'-phosphate oxidase family protein [unclassified Streptomyces]|uniref:pyridoxamine 5'-phosphate oxidase family protein n=1 Tax=unclassified Streptomyces TaxID=2593676 RepID=UPI002DDA784D|nr:pyridoxamine 5'-phosphate oxidase family protein [Streptomyces sp. NBC_00243]WRZ17981.1 pyridoxamine 5'-phosphate oxidase family protein [Streptomyces sp. NBC_00243]
MNRIGNRQGRAALLPQVWRLFKAGATADPKPDSREDALKLVGSVQLGRVAFLHQALPAIRPVSHIGDELGDIVIRTHTGADLLNFARSSEVVACAADEIDPVSRRLERGRHGRRDPGVRRRRDRAGRHRDRLTR